MSDEPQGMMPLAQKAIERNIIACVLSNPTALHECDAKMSDFETPELRVAYDMIMELRDAGHDEVAPSTLRHFYDARPDFQKVVAASGGWKFVETLGLTPDIVNFRLHMTELKRRASIRQTRARLINVLDTVTEGEYTSEDEMLAVLDTALSAGTTKQKHQILEPGGISTDWLIKQTEKFKRGDFKHTGIPISKPLSDVCGRRWKNGSMQVWAGETNVGKSMITNMLVGDFCIKDGIPTLYLDNEMSKDEFEARSMARLSGIETRFYEEGDAFDDDGPHYKRVAATVDLYNAAPITWMQLQELKISSIEPLVRRFLRKYPVAQYPSKMLILDGLKLDGDGDSMWSVGFLAQALKMMTQRYAHEGLVTHCTTQLNRGAAKEGRGKGDAHPTHLDVGLSKLIPDNADDFYLLLHDYTVDDEGEKTFDKEHRRLICTKARHHAILEGKSYLRMHFNGACANLRPDALCGGTATTSGALPVDGKPDTHGI